MLTPLLLTLQIALTAAAVATVLALGVVLATHGRRGASLLDSVLTVPLVLPATVLGYYLLGALGARSVVGRAWEAVTGGQLVFSKTGAVIAATLTAFPMVLQGTRAAFDAIEPSLLEAARTLGATRLGALRRVALPLASRGIAAGVVLGFARACGDFGATLMLAGNIPGETQTASLALFDAVLLGQHELALQLALSLTTLAVAAFVLVRWLGRRVHVD
ncbi:MAG: ABC transporter permease subunit [Myxococcaceae bacterium]